MNKPKTHLIPKKFVPDEQLFHQIVESVRDHAILAISLDGHIASWNRGAERIFGYAENQIINRPFTLIFTEEDIANGIPELELSTAASKGHAEDKRWHVRRDKKYFWAFGMMMPLRDEHNELRGFVKIAQDFTEIKQAAEERERLLSSLEVERNQMAAVLQQMPGGVVVVEAPSGRVIHYNKLSEQILGHSLGQTRHLTENQGYGAVHADGRLYQPGEYPLTRAATLGEIVTDEELIYRRGDGRQIFLRAAAAPIHNAAGKIVAAVLTFNDVTERKHEEEQIAHQAFRDALTNLPNRRLLNHHLERTIAHARRHPDNLFAVMFLDLDRFKIINDSLGHQVGDKLLINVAYKLKVMLRSEDLIARLGGDEFVILLSDIRSIHDAIDIAERIHKELQKPFQIDGQDVFTSTSIGIALSNERYKQPEEILRDADTAMYRAKKNKTKFEIFDPQMHNQMMQLLTLENDLRGALEKNEFQVYYQPILSMTNNRIVGFEALVRWLHPERGLIMPSEFISLAEETSLIKPIGWWVLTEACRQMRQWQKQFPSRADLSISVNVSGSQFAQANFAEQVSMMLKQTGFQAETLKLEITETSLMKHGETATAVIKELKDLGIKLYIDDFGTGYSSLSRLHQFPVDVLKIDRSFVALISSPDEDPVIVQAIIQLAHTLKMEVMAEGVETAAQLSHLRNLGCEYWQGYHCSEPVEKNAASALLLAQ